MRRLVVLLALVLATPAAAGTIHATRRGGAIVGTQAADRLVGGPRTDLIQAAWGGVDRVTCGGGADVVSADLADKVAADCEVVSRRLSVDLYANPVAIHETGVEPSVAAWGSTVVAVYQLGRFGRGGATTIGFAVSRDSGRTWQRGVLPGVTVASTPPGPEQAASDPVITYDAVHAVWLASTLTLEPNSSRVMVASSADGLHWSLPVTATTGPVLDKEWISCDNGATSPFRGRCYLLYTDDARNETVSQSSDDGGVTWSAPVHAAAVLVGTQPAELADGTLVFIAGSFAGEEAVAGTVEGARSTDGGATFTRIVVSGFQSADVSPMRAVSLPSLALDAGGTLYASWGDCRFRASCAANDIVVATSTDGMTWTPPVRVPLAATSSTLNAMIPGLGADPARPGHLGLVYAYFTPGSCARRACQLGIAFVQSPDGGRSWTKPQQLDAEPMQMRWLPESNGRMVGDYFATAFAADRVVPVFALAIAPTGTRLHEAIFAASLRPLG
jgi:hypothetical protein